MKVRSGLSRQGDRQQVSSPQPTLLDYFLLHTTLHSSLSILRCLASELIYDILDQVSCKGDIRQYIPEIGQIRRYREYNLH